MQIKLTVYFLAMMTATGSVMAGGPGLRGYDTNEDGQVTAEEIQAARAAEFVEIDANADGSATLAELRAWLDKSKSDLFSSLDTDGSGTLSSSEWAADKHGPQDSSFKTRLFKLADTDADGALSADEFNAVIGGGSDRSIHMFAHLDADDSGTVTAAEYTSASNPRGGPGREPEGSQQSGRSHNNSSRR